MMLTCKKCGQEKELNCFYVDNGTGRIYRQCKSCISIMKKERRRKIKKPKIFEYKNMLKTRDDMLREIYSLAKSKKTNELILKIKMIPELYKEESVEHG